MYRVVKRFIDLQDDGAVYEVGSSYPRKGMKVSEERLEELASNRNRRGVPLIVNDVPKKASPLTEKGHEEAKTGVDLPNGPSTERKTKKRG